MPFKSRLRIHGYFILINALFAILLACRYFTYLPEFPSDAIGLGFLVLATFSHLVLLSSLAGLCLVPLLWLPRLPRQLLLSFAAAMGLILLFIDTLVFAQYRFHINSVVLDLFFSGQVISFPLMTWVVMITGILLLWAMEFAILHALENRQWAKRLTIGRQIAGAAILALLASNAIHIWAAAHAYQSVTQLKRYLPLFQPVTSNSTMRKYGWIDEEALEKQKLLTMKKQGDLHYPLKPIAAHAVEKPVNIVILAVDSWRADTFNADNTPHMWAFAQKGVAFQQHFSTGNSTRAGVFGLFYGIPGTYWHSAFNNKTSPVLIDRLLALNYQIGVFASAQLYKPEFDQTVFVKVPDLRKESPGATVYERDESLTRDWLTWFSQRDTSRPSFSFLFYDAPHGYSFPASYPHRYKPMFDEVNYLQLNNDTDPQLLMNRYKTSVHFVDSLAGQVLDKLAASGEMDNTLVIITSDHGQEMNDNKLNYWGHNSNFSDAQTHVPFAMVGKGIHPGPSGWGQQLTSHQDVAPTLMQHYLGVESDMHDYTVGTDLLGQPVDRPFLLASSYSKYAVITPDDIMEVGVTGQLDHVDKHYRPLKKQPDYALLQQALEQISRFSK